MDQTTGDTGGTPGKTGDTGKRGRTGKSGASSPYSRRNALILYSVTCILFLMLFARGEVRDDHIAALQRDNTRLVHQVADLQTRTSGKVLCPLYALLVDQIDHLTDKQKARPRIAKQIVVIRAGYKALDCQPAPATTP